MQGRSWLVFQILFWIVVATATQAQTLHVTAGEHDTFTRIVVQTPPGARWTLDGDETTQHLRFEPTTLGFDLRRLFDRIPRTRLANAQAADATLTLTLACPCALKAWQEGPGLVVIDISDPVATTGSAPPRVASAPPSPMPTPPSPGTARTAGIALARRHDQGRARQAPVPQESLRLDVSADSLGFSIAQALSQGLLEPATFSLPPSRPVLSDTGQQAAGLPQNIRITSAVARQNPGDPSIEPLDEECTAAAALAFLSTPISESFNLRFARLMRSLYGEFDEFDPATRQALIELYLGAGFGAEARALIENGPDPGLDREPLLGMSDVLENRMSNSRLRLSRMAACGGPAAVIAVLAGAPAAETAGFARDIALAFADFSAPLRAILGPNLALSLIEANAREEARVVAQATRRSAWVTAGSLTVVDARLDAARGLSSAAAARLADAQRPDAPLVLARLDFALRTDTVLARSVLADATAIASAERNTRAGVEIMQAVILLQARSGAFFEAFSDLDRLETWLPSQGARRLDFNALRDAVWLALARDADDLTLMRTVLRRDDWHANDIALPPRQALAQRLFDLGLSDQATALLPPPDWTSRETGPARTLPANTQSGGAQGPTFEAENTTGLGVDSRLRPPVDGQNPRETERATTLQAPSLPEPEAGPINPTTQISADEDVALRGSSLRATEGVIATMQERSPDIQATPADTTVLPSPPLFDTGTDATDRTGLIARSTTLLDESLRLREALAPLARTAPP